MKPHSDYKGTERDWLGRIPSHWQTVPLWTLYSRSKRTGFPNEELLSVYRDFGVIKKKSRDDNHNNASEDLSTYQLVQPSDLVINKMKAWQGSLGVSKFRGIVSPAYFVLEAHHTEDAGFLHYLLRSLRYITGYMTISKGIRVNQWDLEPQHLSRLPIPLPPLPEQQAIAAFIERETAKLDALVEEQRRLIALLKEKRQAVISHAVTKGLDPTAPLKPSGIDWLGDIPAHWEMKRVKHLVFSRQGIQIGPFGGMLKDLPSEETGFKLYGQENTISGDFEKGSRWIEPERYEELKSYELKAGDLVLTRKGSIGNCQIVPSDACPGIADSDTIRVRVDTDIALPEYVQACCQDAGFIGTQLDLTKRGAILSGLNSSVVANLAFPLPPKAEQVELLAFLLLEEEKFSALTTEATRAIALLKERRAALISAAVTGKVDVRDTVIDEEEAA